MSELVITSLITSMPALIAALAAMGFGLKGTRDAREAKERAAETANEIQTVHIQINKRMDELLAAEKAVSRAEGVDAGRGAESIIPIPVPMPRAREPQAESQDVIEARQMLADALAEQPKADG